MSTSPRGVSLLSSHSRLALPRWVVSSFVTLDCHSIGILSFVVPWLFGRVVVVWHALSPLLLVSSLLCHSVRLRFAVIIVASLV